MLSLDQLPVLGICGSSGSGKTTLIEGLLPALVRQGLKVAVIKHDARHVVLDKPGKDSDRLYRAGADVWLLGDERCSRFHEPQNLGLLCLRLAREYDLVLVESHGKSQLPKIWLLGEGYSQPPPDHGQWLALFSREEARGGAVLTWLSQWLERQWRAVPAWGCVLIGGRSKRMGRPKHLLTRDGVSWLERTVAELTQQVERVVISGSGEVPPTLSHLPRLADVAELGGPLSGILACLRWQPGRPWLITACDQPDIEAEALRWLLAGQRPGVWAILPDLEGRGRVEPLLALYDGRCRLLLEELVLRGCLRPGGLAGHPKVLTPQPPAWLHRAWRNVNSADELAPPGITP